jgi:predicted nucleic acid-binding protein
VRESGSTELERRLRGEQVVSSALSRVELGRALLRTTEAQRSAGEVLRRVRLIAVDEEVLSSAATLPPPILRSHDAIHLATAMRIATDIDAFITYNRQLGRSAAAAGLGVETPRS